MSGGSYNYLYGRDADEIMHYLTDLEDMRSRLGGLAYANDAAIETQALRQNIEQFMVETQATLTRLAPVWRAIEWWDSCDSDEEGVKQALLRYRLAKGIKP